MDEKREKWGQVLVYYKYIKVQKSICEDSMDDTWTNVDYLATS